MEPIRPPRTVKFYQLLKMATKNGLNIGSCGSAPAANYIGSGMYLTLQDAEHQRTLEILKDTDTGGTNSYHIFELEFPNPVYKE